MGALGVLAIVAVGAAATGCLAALWGGGHDLELASPPPSSSPALAALRPLRISFIDVSHGDATFMALPDGRTLLVDTGKQEAARSRLVPFLRKALAPTGGRLDFLILTHQHFDHVGGVDAILDHFPVGEVWTNGLALRPSHAKRLARLGVPVRVPRVGQEIAVGEVRLLVVSSHEASQCSRLLWSRSINDCSLGLRLAYRDFSALLPADLMRVGTQRLLDGFGDRVRSTVLRMPHHAIRLGNLDALLDHVRPELAVASASSRDPTAAVLAQYQRHSIAVVATRERGDITLETTGTGFQLRTAR